MLKRMLRCMLSGWLLMGTALAVALAGGCDDDADDDGGPGAGGSGAATTSTTSTSSGGGAGGQGGDGGSPLPAEVTVQLSPQAGVTGTQRVNFAIPLQAGQLDDEAAAVVLASGEELPAARRGLSPRGDGSYRSLQLQVDVDVDAVTDLTVQLGATPTTTALTLVAVEDTLVSPDGEQGPQVWVVLPATWLSASRFAGPLLAEADASGDEASWASLCDYEAWDTAAFLAAGAPTTRSVWLYDRGTVMYRGYARRGDLPPLQSAYVETSMYRNLITGTGSDTRNGLPQGAANDVKYTYAQNLALHYLLSGDDRFRESAEDIAEGMGALWSDPGYAGGADFWTERHAGLALLAYLWAGIVSDDQAADFAALADAAVTAYIEVQETYPVGYADTEARCFAHHADAHGESYGYFGCSPWMSAILADGLHTYVEEGGALADQARTALVKLARILARDGRDGNDIPYYWMGVDTSQDEADGYDEHIGESAYVIAMGWLHDGKSDPALRSAADTLVSKLASDGVVGQLRSFNWQCRSAVATPWFLQP